MLTKFAIGTGALFLFLGAVAPAYAQGDQHEKEQGKAEQGQQQRSTPQQHQAAPQQAQQHQRTASKPVQTAQRPQQAFGGNYHGGVSPTEPTHGGVHPSGVPQHQGQVRSGFLQSRASSWTGEHRTWQQRGGYNGYRIPDNRFGQYFGSGHVFRINRLPMLFVGGYPRFQYDGYWVTFMDPWPEDWPPTWYETDNAYIDWAGDGYYLYDPAYPGVAIAVTISF